MPRPVRRRLLPRLGYCWRRARPTPYKADPRKAERLAAIEAVLASPGPGTEVFLVDEADIDWTPRIGFGRRPRGTQEAIPTPGQNRKRHLAGALHARSGHVVWTEGEGKNSELFIALLECPRRRATARGLGNVLEGPEWAWISGDFLSHSRHTQPP